MARRRRRQVKPQETLITVCAAAMGGLVAITWGGQSSEQQSLFVLVLLMVLVLLLAVAAYQFYRWAQRQRMLRILMNSNVDQMSGLDFERYVAELFRRQGYRVTMTPINDYGVDIVLVKGGVRTAVQTKRYSKPVAQAAVREAVAGMVRYDCSRCMVVTNATFTKAARELAHSNHCTLIDREELARLAALAQPKPTATP